MAVTISYTSGANLETIAFDSASSIRPMFENEIAEHPIEKGSDAADNSRAKPETVTVEGVFTDYPLSVNGGGIGVAHAKGRAAGVMKKLIDLKSAGTRFRVSTKIREFENMMILSIAANSDKIRGAVKLTVAFKQVQIVASEVVNVTIAANRGGQKKTEKGKQTAEEVKPTEPMKSALAKAIDSGAAKKAVDLAGEGINALGNGVLGNL